MDKYNKYAETLLREFITKKIDFGKIFADENIVRLIQTEGEITDYILKKSRKEIIKSIQKSDYFIYFEQFEGESNRDNLIEKVFKYFNDRGEFTIIYNIVNKHFHQREVIYDLVNSNDRLSSFFNFLVLLAMFNFFIKESKPIQFNELFFRKEKVTEVIKILQVKGYINEEQNWIFESKSRKLPLALLKALKDERVGLIRPGNITTQAKVFYNHFGLSVGKGKYITERSLIDSPKDSIIEEFIKIFMPHNHK